MGVRNGDFGGGFGGGLSGDLEMTFVSGLVCSSGGIKRKDTYGRGIVISGRVLETRIGDFGGDIVGRHFCISVRRRSF